MLSAGWRGFESRGVRVTLGSLAAGCAHEEKMPVGLGKVSCSALHADCEGLVARLREGTTCVQTVLESGVSSTRLKLS